MVKVDSRGSSGENEMGSPEDKFEGQGWDMKRIGV